MLLWKKDLVRGTRPWYPLRGRFLYSPETFLSVEFHLSFVPYVTQDYLALLWPTNILPNPKAEIQQFWQDLTLEGFFSLLENLWQVWLTNWIVLCLSWNLLSESCDSNWKKQLFRPSTFLSLVLLPWLLQHWLSRVLWKPSSCGKVKAGLEFFKFINTSCM